MKSISDSNLPATDATIDAAIAQDMDFFAHMRRHPAPKVTAAPPIDCLPIDIAA